MPTNEPIDETETAPIPNGCCLLMTARQCTETRQLVLMTGRCGSREFACRLHADALRDWPSFRVGLLDAAGLWAVGFRLTPAGQICHDAADWDLAIGNAIRRGAEPANAPQNAQND